jgi:hypothetical protein
LEIAGGPPSVKGAFDGRPGTSRLAPDAPPSKNEGAPGTIRDDPDSAPLTPAPTISSGNHRAGPGLLSETPQRILSSFLLPFPDWFRIRGLPYRADCTKEVQDRSGRGGPL